MTDAELLAEVKRHWEHWAGHLGLTPNWWISFQMSKKAGDNLQVQWGPDDAAHNGYRRLTLAVGTGVLKAINAKKPVPHWDLSQCVLHEAVHLLLDPLADGALMLLNQKVYERDLKLVGEGVTDEIASIVLRLHAETGCKE